VNKETTTKETRKPMAFRTYTCKHPSSLGGMEEGHEWSLTITYPYEHVSLSACNDRKDITVFGMQPEDMLNLASAILSAAVDLNHNEAVAKERRGE